MIFLSFMNIIGRHLNYLSSNRTKHFQGYTPLGHLLVLLVFIISLFAIFGLMWLFVSISNYFSNHMSKYIKQG